MEIVVNIVAMIAGIAIGAVSGITFMRRWWATHSEAGA